MQKYVKYLSNFQAVFTEERPFEVVVNEHKMEHKIEYINFGKKEIYSRRNERLE